MSVVESEATVDADTYWTAFAADTVLVGTGRDMAPDELGPPASRLPALA